MKIGLRPLFALLLLAAWGCQSPKQDSHKNMFEINVERFGTLDQYKLTNPATGEHVAIIPGYGATLNAARLRAGDGQLHDVIAGSPDQAQLMGEGTKVYKGQVLFPFPNRIKDGEYRWQNTEYKLPINEPDRGHALHQLLYQQSFEIVSKDATAESARLRLRTKQNPRPDYPFQYDLFVTFTLDTMGVTCQLEAENHSNQPMPFAASYHPYFQTGSALDSLILTLPSKTIVDLDSRMIPTGGNKPYTKFNEPTVAGNLQLDNCFDVNQGQPGSEMVLQDPNKNFGLHIWQETGEGKFNWLQIYTPDHRRSAAIEPMTAIPNAINNGVGLIVLPPKQSWSAKWGFYVK